MSTSNEDLSKWPITKLVGKLTVPQLCGIFSVSAFLLSGVFGLGYKMGGRNAEIELKSLRAERDALTSRIAVATHGPNDVTEELALAKRELTNKTEQLNARAAELDSIKKFTFIVRVENFHNPAVHDVPETVKDIIDSLSTKGSIVVVPDMTANPGFDRDDGIPRRLKFVEKK